MRFLMQANGYERAANAVSASFSLVTGLRFVYEKATLLYGKELSMNAQCYFPVSPTGRRITRLICVCFLALVFGACAKGGSKTDSDKPADPNQQQIAYGVSLTKPSAWKVAGSVTAQTATKAALDSRRQGGERVLLLEAAGPASPRGLESMIGLFLVNEEGTFMPRNYAEKMQPHEFAAMSKDLLDREKAAAKKNKTASGLLDLQVARDDIGGKLAISQRMLVAGPAGRPVRLMNWDVYLPGGAGLAVKTVCDPETPNAESEVTNTVKSLRVQ